MDKIKVALIKCDNYELSEVKSAINRGIDLLGGIDLFIKEGDKILLKPNLLASESAEKSVTTHPVVFEAIISILQEIKEKKNEWQRMGLEMKEREDLEMHGVVVVANLTCDGQENRSQHTNILVQS